jgi:hypothetical protein
MSHSKRLKQRNAENCAAQNFLMIMQCRWQALFLGVLSAFKGTGNGGLTAVVMPQAGHPAWFAMSPKTASIPAPTISVAPRAKGCVRAATNLPSVLFPAMHCDAVTSPTFHSGQ